MLNFGPLLSAPLAGNPGLQAVQAAIRGVVARPSAAVLATYGLDAKIQAHARRPHAAAVVTQLLGVQAALQGRTPSPSALVEVLSETAGHIKATLARPTAAVAAARGVAAALANHTAEPHGVFAAARGVATTVKGVAPEPVSAIRVGRGIAASATGTTSQATAQARANRGNAAVILGKTSAPHGQGSGAFYPYGVQIRAIAPAPTTDPWAVYAANPVPGIGAELAYLTRIATSLAGVMPGPPLLKSLRGGSIEARTLDFTPELIATADGLITITGITVSRVDGTLMGPNDLTITPPFYTPPWLTGTMLNPATGAAIGAAIVGWWCTAGMTVAAAGPVFYKVSVSVTTANGSALTRDTYQVVTDALGAI